MKLTKLWKVRVNDLGWLAPATCYRFSRKECELIADRHPAADRIEYAGAFTPEHAFSKVYGDIPYIQRKSF